MTDFWSGLPRHLHGTPQNPHTYHDGPTPRDRRECTYCHEWRPPVCESLTVHPADRAQLNEQLPTARVYGEPLPDGCLILEDPHMMRGTLQVRIEGRDVVVTLGEPPVPKWVRIDPVSGLPVGMLV